MKETVAGFQGKKVEPVDQTLKDEIEASLADGRLSCAAAFKVAKKLKVTNKQVGDAANKLNIRMVNCQLGCF